MTITLPLQPQEEAKLIAIAQAKGLSTDALVREALDKILADTPERLADPSGESRPIWEVMLDNMNDVPPEEFAKLPKDGASEHDHYLYGHPKRNQRKAVLPTRFTGLPSPMLRTRPTRRPGILRWPRSRERSIPLKKF
jgi:hypothetical protein